MASPILNHGPKGSMVDPKEVTLRIYPNGAGAPTFEADGGASVVASVTLAATGKFLVTLTESYFKVVRAFAQYQDSADNVDLYAQLGDFANVQHGPNFIGTKGQPVTFVVKLKTGTANTNVAAGNQVCIFVSVVFEDVER